MPDNRSIPFFDYPALFAEIQDEVMESVRDVFQRGAYIMQKDLADFEAGLAAYLGVRHAIGVADGTMGLLLPLMTCASFLWRISTIRVLLPDVYKRQISQRSRATWA